MRTAAAVVLIALAVGRAAQAQQGSVQVSASAQAVAADPARRAGQQTIEPDFGVTILQPASRFGTLFADLHAVRRGDRPHAGQLSLALRDLKIGGVTWSITAGDTAAPPSISGYSLANLLAPQFTFAGAHLSGFTPRGSMVALAGRTTAIRNIFGSDPLTLGQDVAQANGRFRVVPRVELFARGSRVRTRDVREFTASIDEGEDAGAGARVKLTPVLELTADGGTSWFRRRGARERERSPTALAALQWAPARGWLQVNAHRVAPGFFAIVNTPFLDREGAFVAGELRASSHVRLFGGFEAFRTNLDPEAAAGLPGALPRGVSERAYAGARLNLGGRTTITLRAEEGDRTARPVQTVGVPHDSDTGLFSVDLQTGTKRLSAFARYDRRENVDHASGAASYSQQTSTVQLLGRAAERTQVFANALIMRREDASGGGQTFWQTGGGAQWQLPRRQLWLRGEGYFSLNEDWLNDLSLPHQFITLGLSGQLNTRTALAIDLSVDRAPQQALDGSAWLGRSMLRVMHTIPTGSARLPGAARTRANRRGSGSISGTAFADWNANGLQDVGEEPLAGVPFVYGPSPRSPENATTPPAVSTGPDGRFAFVNVPLGRATIGLDLTALPVDYDPPADARRDTEVRARGGERLAFGLVPLGSITGRVLNDLNGDGAQSAGDTPVDGAVVLLDEGARSEQTRAGSFRFDGVRAGQHAVRLLQESLSDGAVIAGSASTEVRLERERLQANVVFLVKVEKRPEIRKVFPPKSGAGAPQGHRTDAAPPIAAAGAPAPALPGAAAKADAMRASPPSARPKARAATKATVKETPLAPAAGARRPAPVTDRWYVIQLAALRNRSRAWKLVRQLQAQGVEAYLSEDAGGLSKVRIGSYRSQAEADQHLPALKQRHPTARVMVIGTVLTDR